MAVTPRLVQTSYDEPETLNTNPNDGSQGWTKKLAATDLVPMEQAQTLMLNPVAGCQLAVNAVQRPLLERSAGWRPTSA